MDQLLKDNGIEVFWDPVQGLDKNWQCWADPDGNPIEFMQIDPDSSQAKAARGENTGN